MSLALLEKKWKYLERKEQVMRDAFDRRRDHCTGLAVPIVVKDRLRKLMAETQPAGYDPFKPCKCSCGCVCS